MMLALIILSGILSEVSLRQVRVRRAPPAHIFAGRPFLMSMSVRNAKRRLPSFSIEVEDLVGAAPLDKKCYFLKIPAGRTQETSYRYLFARRGLYRYDGMRISTKFPFALFRKSREAPLAAEVLVYPPIRSVPELRAADRLRIGEDGEMRKGRGGEFHGLREWREGEDVRDVHWRTTAHAGRLIIREWEVESARRVTLVLNNLRADPPPASHAGLAANADRAAYDDELEDAVSAAASVADRLLDDDIEVSLVTHTEEVGFGRGPDQRWRILRALALIEFVPPERAVDLAEDPCAERILVTHAATPPPAATRWDQVIRVGAAGGAGA